MIFSEIKKRLKEFITISKKLIFELKEGSEKAVAIKKLWTDKRYSEAKKLFLKKTVRVLDELKPRKGRAKFMYGGKDPFDTGNVTNIYLCLSPYLSSWLYFEPVFDKEVLSGRVRIKGRVRIFFIVEAFLRIFFNKKLRLLYKQTRQILSS